MEPRKPPRGSGRRATAIHMTRSAIQKSGANKRASQTVRRRNRGKPELHTASLETERQRQAGPTAMVGDEGCRAVKR